MLFSSRVRVRIRAGMRFSVWLASCYAYVFCATFDCNCHGPDFTLHWFGLVLRLVFFFLSHFLFVLTFSACVLVS